MQRGRPAHAESHVKLRTFKLGAFSRALLIAAMLAVAGMPLADTLHQLGHLQKDRALAGPGHSQVKPICQVCAALSAIGHALPSRPRLAADCRIVDVVDLATALSATPRRLQSYLERAPPIDLEYA